MSTATSYWWGWEDQPVNVRYYPTAALAATAAPSRLDTDERQRTADPGRRSLVEILDRADGPVTYLLRDRLYVNGEVERAAEAAMTFASLQLPMPRPTLVWFVPEGEAHAQLRRATGETLEPTFRFDPVGGLAHVRSQTIAVRADQTPAETVETVAHECYHCAYGSARVGEDEELATAYGREVRKYVLSPHSGRVATVRSYDGWPERNGAVGRGIVEPDDVLIARDAEDEPAVFVNLGSKWCPEWRVVERP